MPEEPSPPALERKTVPPHVDAAVLRALEKLPADRWQTAAQFAEALTGARWSPDRRPAVASGRGALGARGRSPARACLGGSPARARGAPASAGPVRFSAEFDAGVQPTFTPIVRLSPDGRQLFVTAMVNRREEVLRRPLDRMRMEVIPGAGQGDQGTGNSRPFVSPDGRWIAYAKQGRLWKVPVEGGPPIDLAAATGRAEAGAGTASWSTAPSYNTGLWMVSEGGGDERMLTAPDTAQARAGSLVAADPARRRPRHLHRVPYADRRGHDRGASRSAPASGRCCSPGGVFGFYVPTGHLLYAVGRDDPSGAVRSRAPGGDRHRRSRWSTASP